MIDGIAERVPEVVERVETASLRDLGSIHIDDVYRQMDWLLERRPGPMDLYRRWEAQNWRTQDLDFSQDAQHWAGMSGGFESIRVELRRTLTAFFVGEQAVTDTLSPLVHAAPDEASRIFLSTQLVDEARHAVFFSRFFAEVVGLPHGLEEALAVLRPAVSDGFRQMFDDALTAATEAVRRNPDDFGAWIEAVTIYHLVVEGMLALTGQKFLLQIIREMGILPAFYSGFTAVARDESRHVNFGVWALLHAGRRDASLLHRVVDVVFRLLEPACRVVATPERKFAVSIETTPENLQINPFEVAAFSLRALAKRLRAAGVGTDICSELEERGMLHYRAAWDEYETMHGEEHPYRYFESSVGGPEATVLLTP